MSKKYEVVNGPISFGGTMHNPGEQIEAEPEELKGFLAAGYVKPARTSGSKETPGRRARKKGR